MQTHLESKTIIGLLILLACILGLSAFGKLTAEAVEAIKWVGATFMSVRIAANVGETFGKKE